MLVIIANEFEVNLSSLHWVVNVYFLVVATLVVVGGKLGDKFGRRKLYLIGLMWFVLGLVIGGLSDAVWLLIVSRVFLAMGTALIVPASLSIIEVVFDPASRRTAFSIWGANFGLGFAVGPLLGGFIADIFGWHWFFWFSVPLMIMAALIALVAMPESQDKKMNTSVDVGGVISLGISIFGIILYLDQSPRWGYFSLFSSIVLVISFTALIIFLWIELKVKSPLVNFENFKERTFLAANVVIFSLNFSFMGLLYLLNIVFQNHLTFKYSALDAALAMLPMNVCFFIFSLGAGKMMKRLGAKKFMLIGISAISVGSFYLCLISSDALYVQYVLPMIIFGAGVGFLTAPSQMIALNAIPESNVGEASGITNLTRYLGATFGVAVTNLIYSIVSKDQLINLLHGMNVEPIDEKIVEGWVVGVKYGGRAMLDRLDPILLSRLLQEAKEALFSGASAALFVMGAVCLLAMLACFFLIQENKS